MFVTWGGDDAKRQKHEGIIAKSSQVEMLMVEGMASLDVIEKVGVSDQTSFWIRKHYGGIAVE